VTQSPSRTSLHRSILAQSFDQPVGAYKDGWWHFEPERLGGLEIDDQLELGRLFNGEVGGARTFENLVHLAGCTPSLVRKFAP
jgi:hypothetical protein